MKTFSIAPLVTFSWLLCHPVDRVAKVAKIACSANFIWNFFLPTLLLLTLSIQIRYFNHHPIYSFPSLLSPLRVANVDTYLILHKRLTRFNSLLHLTNWKSVSIFLINIVGSSWNRYNAPFLTCYYWFYLIKYASRSEKSTIL